MKTHKKYDTGIDRAFQIVIDAYFGQKDKTGLPYILHILEVIEGLHRKDEEFIVVAILHDVVEDTKGIINAKFLLRDGFDKLIVDAVEVLTRKEGETYREYIIRVTQNRIATIVKLGDIRSHLRGDRLFKIEGLLRERYIVADKELRAALRLWGFKDI